MHRCTISYMLHMFTLMFAHVNTHVYVHVHTNVYPHVKLIFMLRQEIFSKILNKDDWASKGVGSQQKDIWVSGIQM